MNTDLNELRELREIVMGEFNTDYGGGNVGLTPAGEKLVELINEKIAAISADSTTQGSTDELTADEKLAEQNRLGEIGKYRFYFCESTGEYLLGKRIDNFYYARWSVNAWTWCMSKYLPWGETVNGFTYSSEPVEIGADEFFNGWIQANQAYRRPTADEVAQIDRAVDELSQPSLEPVYVSGIKVDMVVNQVCDTTRKIAITALRKMKGE